MVRKKNLILKLHYSKQSYLLSATMNSSASAQPEEISFPFNLQETRKATIRTLNGKVFVDLREHYFDKSGNSCPGKKGLCLTDDQFERIIEMADEIKQAIKDAKK